MFHCDVWQHHTDPLLNGEQWIFRFGDIGCSVIRNDHSYGGKSGLFEMAVIVWDDDDERWSIADNNVRGWLTVDDVNAILEAFLTIQGRGFDE